MNLAKSDAALICVDWGTSSLRAFLIDRNAEMLDVVTSSQGIVHVEQRDFSAVLNTLIKDWINDRQLPVIASGMITSGNGWLETPYLNAPTDLEDLAKNLAPSEGPSGVRL